MARSIAAIAWLAVCSLGFLLGSTQVDVGMAPPGLLTPGDKAGLAEVLRLKAEAGDRVWPGFAESPIPILLFNNDFEFLIGFDSPPSPWEMVPNDSFAGAPYYRRPRGRAQAFAVEIGGRWAGSIAALAMMNAKGPFKLPTDFYTVLALHEIFHAFQAARAPGRFARAVKAYATEDRYPFKDAGFAASWTAEGASLFAGIQAVQEADVAAAARDFLGIRDKRRSAAGLLPELLEFERELEWLEGLAKYAEIRFYEIAAALPPGPAAYRYKVPMLFIQSDYGRLRNALGIQSGDLRFYLSGFAQARLLDRLAPGWKDKGLPEEAALEDLLRGAVLPHR